MTIDAHRFQLAIELAGRTAPQLQSVIESFGAEWRIVPLPGAGPRATLVSPVLGYTDLPRVQEVVRAVRVAGARVEPTSAMTLRIDGARFDARTHKNLRALLDKQGELLARVLGRPLDHLALRTVKHRDPFPKGAIEVSLTATLHSGEVTAAIVLMLAIVERALCARAASSKTRPFDPISAKYQFRCFLLRVGLVGEAFRDTRAQLLKRLSGSAAWKRGRPPRPEMPGRIHLDGAFG